MKTIKWLDSNTRSSQCDGCGRLMFWINFYGKKHPFDIDGGSHVLSCSSLRYRKVSLAMLGDIDTFYRERWRELFLDEPNGFDRDGLVKCGVPQKTASRIAEVLRWYGGPLRSESYPTEDIIDSISWGGQDDSEALIAISVNDWIWYGLHRCLPPEHRNVPDVYNIDGLYLVKESC